MLFYSFFFLTRKHLDRIHDCWLWKNNDHLPRVSQLHQFLLLWKENQNSANTSQISPLVQYSSIAIILNFYLQHELVTIYRLTKISNDLISSYLND